MSQLSLMSQAVDVRQRVAAWRAAHETVALVPTMGNLHDGHLSLAKLAAASADRVLMTIFVNPTQFGIGEDFESYPRTLDKDQAMVAEHGVVDVLFVPKVDEVYPNGPDAAFQVAVPALGKELCGASRPGHFDGVATVVLRLLNITTPDVLVLGRKDYQQLVILERMVADLRLPVQVVSGETLRHDDGLAISSRNGYLTEEERRNAPVLHDTLVNIRDAIASGASDYAALESDACAMLAAAGLKPDYVEIRIASTLTKPNGRHRPEELIVLAAAWLGKARLIDNLRIDV